MNSGNLHIFAHCRPLQLFSWTKIRSDSDASPLMRGEIPRKTGENLGAEILLLAKDAEDETGASRIPFSRLFCRISPHILSNLKQAKATKNVAHQKNKSSRDI